MSVDLLAVKDSLVCVFFISSVEQTVLTCSTTSHAGTYQLIIKYENYFINRFSQIRALDKGLDNIY